MCKLNNNLKYTRKTSVDAVVVLAFQLGKDYRLILSSVWEHMEKRHSHILLKGV